MTSHRFFHKEIKKQYVGRKGQKMDEIDFLFLIKLHQKIFNKKNEQTDNESSSNYVRRVVCTRLAMAH